MSQGEMYFVFHASFVRQQFRQVIKVEEEKSVWFFEENNDISWHSGYLSYFLGLNLSPGLSCVKLLTAIT